VIERTELLVSRRDRVDSRKYDIYGLPLRPEEVNRISFPTLGLRLFSSHLLVGLLHPFRPIPLSHLCCH
jgi:hypothetical protein